MATQKGENRAERKRGPGGFVPLCHRVTQSHEFRSLSAHAVKLLIDLLSDYTGRNNGDLSATWSVMKDRGWKSRDTLTKAIRELEDSDFIVVTRRGQRRTCNLYAVTFFAIDPCPDKTGRTKIDVASTQRPPETWRRTPPPPLIPTQKTQGGDFCITPGGLKHHETDTPGVLIPTAHPRA